MPGATLFNVRLTPTARLLREQSFDMISAGPRGHSLHIIRTGPRRVIWVYNLVPQREEATSAMRPDISNMLCLRIISRLDDFLMSRTTPRVSVTLTASDGCPYRL